MYQCTYYTVYTEGRWDRDCVRIIQCTLKVDGIEIVYIFNCFFKTITNIVNKGRNFKVNGGNTSLVHRQAKAKIIYIIFNKI